MKRITYICLLLFFNHLIHPQDENLHYRVINLLPTENTQIQVREKIDGNVHVINNVFYKEISSKQSFSSNELFITAGNLDTKITNDKREDLLIILSPNNVRFLPLAEFKKDSLCIYNLSERELYVNVNENRSRVPAQGFSYFEKSKSLDVSIFLVAAKVNENIRLVTATRLALYEYTKVLLLDMNSNGQADYQLISYKK